MAFKFVLLVASLACASAGYIPTDNSHLSYAPALSYKNVAPVLSKTIVQEPQLYHGYTPAAPSVVVSKPLALTETLPVSYSAPHSLYQAPAFVKNLEYAPKPLSYAPYTKTFFGEPSYAKTIIAEPSYGKTIVAEPSYGKTIIAEPTYGKTFVSEPFYTKNVYAEPIYPAKTLIAEPVYGKNILAQSTPIYGGKVLSYAPSA
uniref:Uncharacterized protein n=1 Tax=Anopheles atroparvus TaxID=41427 RepID=A0AAG5DRD6_ANOAO